MGKILDIYVRKMVAYLSEQAKKIISEARRTKETKNISYNQRDAYGALIYYNGKLKRSILTVATADGQRKSPNYGFDDLSYEERHRGYNGVPDGTGVEWANMFKREYKPKSTGFEMIVFNAAFYSKIQEEGGGGKKKRGKRKKYQIISQIFGSMDEIAAKFNAATVKPYNLNK